MTPFKIAPSAKNDLDEIRNYFVVFLGNLDLAERILTEL